VNRGEALSLVSKFDVSVGNLKDGMVIRNNFATGRAAQVLTETCDAAEATKALLQNGTVVVPATIERTQSTASRREEPIADPPSREVARSSSTPRPTPTITNHCRSHADASPRAA
jgi:predicted metal-dependent phosphoesterase TrpH